MDWKMRSRGGGVRDGPRKGEDLSGTEINAHGVVGPHALFHGPPKIAVVPQLGGVG